MELNPLDGTSASRAARPEPRPRQVLVGLAGQALRRHAALALLLLAVLAGTILLPGHARAEMRQPAGLTELRARAEGGDAAAQFELGKRYFSEMKRDPERDAEAQKWFHRAADQGYAPAETKLGSIYAMGRGVTKDLAAAASWYQRAAEHGDPEAMTRLGNMYEFGKGVPRDHALAGKWINQGNEIASRPTRKREALALVGVLLALLAYAGSLWSLQQNRIGGWWRTAVAVVVHAGGVVLVLNTLNTYGLPELLFPDCSYGDLAASCWKYQDTGTRQLAETLRNWQMVNLIFRFMAGVGVVLDALAIWYVVYLARRFRERRAIAASPGLVHSASDCPGESSDFPSSTRSPRTDIRSSGRSADPARSHWLGTTAVVFLAWLATGVLTAIAFRTGMITLDFSLMVVPALVLVAAPWAFALSTAVLLATLVAGGRGNVERSLAFVCAVLVLVGAAGAAAWSINRPLIAQWHALVDGDHRTAIERDAIHAIALLQIGAPPGGRPGACGARCQQLLLTGAVQSVLAVAGAASPGGDLLDPARPAIGYRIEGRESCAPPANATVDELSRWREGDAQRREIPNPPGGKVCLIGEHARLSDSDLVVLDERIADGRAPEPRDRWDFQLDTLTARRFSLYRWRDGRAEEIVRQTVATCYPLFVPLWVSLQQSVPAFASHPLLLGEEYGLRRRRIDHAGEDLDRFFQDAFGLGPAPNAAAAARPAVVSHPPEPLPFDPQTMPIPELAAVVRSALADASQAADSPRIRLVGTYLRRVAREGQGDVQLIIAAIGDYRVVDFAALDRIATTLGPANASLALPILDRIARAAPEQTALLVELSLGFDALAPGAAIPVMSRLEAIARDPQRRLLVFHMLPRLAEQGPGSLPLLVELFDTGPATAGYTNAGGAIVPGGALALAGLAGMCRLGPDAASAAPRLWSRLAPFQNASHLGPVELSEVRTLWHMGQGDHLASFFTQPDLAARQARRLLKPAAQRCSV